MRLVMCKTRESADVKTKIKTKAKQESVDVKKENNSTAPVFAQENASQTPKQAQRNSLQGNAFRQYALPGLCAAVRAMALREVEQSFLAPHRRRAEPLPPRDIVR